MDNESQEDYFEAIEASFESFIDDYKLNPADSISDILFELFAAGFDSAVEILSEEEDE